MKIKILNKNNNSVYEVDEAPVLTDTRNETLDSGTIVISNQISKLEMSPYDIVELQDDLGSKIKYMCIDTYVETLLCVNPRIYRYEISLFSETKLLEGIVLPNLKITKMPNISRSIFYYINQYMTEYCPKIRVKDNNSYIFGYKYQWDTAENRDKFSDDCPEMQWNMPTLREVLNDLMMVKDCIPVLKNGVLEFMDLTEVNNKDWTDDNSHINYVTRSKSSEDYVSELQVDLKNVTSSDGAYVTKVEYVPFVANEEDVALNTQTAHVETKYPIYRIKSLKMMFPGSYTTTAGATNPYDVVSWYEFDMMIVPGLVCEYQEWLTKQVEYRDNPPTSTSGFGQSRNWSVYYTRGDNKIDNFFGKTKWFLWVTSTLIETLTKAIVYDNSPSGVMNWDGVGDKYYKVMFKIEYETLSGSLFRSSKGDTVEHDRVVIDNQTNSYVDAYNQGFMEYQKANRLGNEQLQINARYESNETLMKIGDTFDDCVIYQCQYQYFKNHTEVNALATKNYILREYFTGVKSKIRSWVIASGSEALERHDLNKTYCEFSYNSCDIDESVTWFRRNYFLSPLVNYSANFLKYVAVLNHTDNSGVVPEPYKNLPTYYCCDLINRIIGNSLVFTFGYKDNFYLEKSVDINEINLDNTSIDYTGNIDWAQEVAAGGIPVKQYSYANDIGEYNSAEVTFCSDIKVIPRMESATVYSDPVNGNIINPNPNNDERRQFEFYCFMRPRILRNSFFDEQENIRYVQFYKEFTHHKDSQEIPVYSTQIEFCTDTRDICFSKKWLNKQEAVSVTDNDISGYKALIFNKNKYDFRKPNEHPTDGLVIEYNVTFALDETGNFFSETAYIVFNSLSLNSQIAAKTRAESIVDGYCVYINDGDALTQDVLLALNNIPKDNCIGYQDGNIYHPAIAIHLNVLKTRNKNIYSPDNYYLIIDKI